MMKKILILLGVLICLAVTPVAAGLLTMGYPSGSVIFNGDNISYLVAHSSIWLYTPAMYFEAKSDPSPACNMGGGAFGTLTGDAYNGYWIVNGGATPDGYTVSAKAEDPIHGAISNCYDYVYFSGTRPPDIPKASLTCFPSTIAKDGLTYCIDTSTYNASLTRMNSGIPDATWIDISSGGMLGFQYPSSGSYYPSVYVSKTINRVVYSDSAPVSAPVVVGGYHSIQFTLIGDANNFAQLPGTIDITENGVTVIRITMVAGAKSYANFYDGHTYTATGYAYGFTPVSEMFDSTGTTGVTILVTTNTPTPVPTVVTTIPVPCLPGACTPTIAPTPTHSAVPTGTVVPTPTSQPTGVQPTVATPTPTPTPPWTPTPPPSANYVYTGNVGNDLPNMLVTVTSTSTGVINTFVWTVYDQTTATQVSVPNTNKITFKPNAYNDTYVVVLTVTGPDASAVHGESFLISREAIPTIQPTPTPVPTVTPMPVTPGGTISFDKPSYASGQVAAITYSFTPLGFSLANEQGNVTVYDNYGQILNNIPVASQNGTVYLTLDPYQYVTGTYRGYLQSYGGWMGTTITTYNTTTFAIDNGVILSGRVKSATTNLSIYGAAVNVSQSSVATSTTTNASGYWTSSGFTTGDIIATASASGYAPCTKYLNFGTSQTVSDVDFSLINNAVNSSITSVTGVTHSSFGGQAPIPKALVILTSRTGGTTTNISTVTGFYQFTNLTPGNTYSVYSSDVVGFQNSPIRQFVAGDFSTILTLNCPSCFL